MSSLSLCSVSCSIDVSTVSDRNLGPVNTCYKCTQLASCHAIALSRFRGLESSRGKVRCPDRFRGRTLAHLGYRAKARCRRHSRQPQSVEQGSVRPPPGSRWSHLAHDENLRNGPACKPRAEFTATAASPGVAPGFVILALLAKCLAS